MARKKGEPAASKEPASPTMVRLDPDLARKAKVIAGAADLSLPEFINSRLRPVLEAEYRKVVRELGMEVEGAG